ncbi:MAG: OmpA/MotB family protein [Saprospiraceae bacterium]
MKALLSLLLPVLVLTSCVSKRKYADMLGARDEYRSAVDNLQIQLDDCRNEKDRLRALLQEKDNRLAGCQSETETLRNQLEYVKATNNNLLERLSDLSVVSKAGAESIAKSLEAMSEQNKYIKDLNAGMQRKDSLNLALVMNIKRSLANINDEDIQVEVRKGVVYISISDKLLFKSGRYELSDRANEVLGKVAKVLKDHSTFEVLVEGHTDNVPIRTDCMDDNWDLSVMRATAVVRHLQTVHGVAPERMIAGGRSEYVPKTTNGTAEGRQLNRRTEIVLSPELDQFFKLLEAPPAGN